MTLPEAYDFFFVTPLRRRTKRLRGQQRPPRLQLKSSGRMYVSSSSKTAKSRGRGTRGRSQAPPLQAGPVLAPPPGDPMPISIPEAYEHFLMRTGQGAPWGQRPFSRRRSQSPPGQSSGEWGLAPHRSLAQPQWNSSPWPSGKQVCVAGPPGLSGNTLSGEFSQEGHRGGTGTSDPGLYWWGASGVDLLRGVPPPASSPTPRRQSRWGSPSQAGGGTQCCPLVFSPRQLGSSLSSLHCLQVRLTHSL